MTEFQQILIDIPERVNIYINPQMYGRFLILVFYFTSHLDEICTFHSEVPNPEEILRGTSVIVRSVLSAEDKSYDINFCWKNAENKKKNSKEPCKQFREIFGLMRSIRSKVTDETTSHAYNQVNRFLDDNCPII